MKKILIILLLTAFAGPGYAQVKGNGFDGPQVIDGIISPNQGSLFGFLNSENFSMHHTFSMSYSAAGNQGLALGVYTNSMMYKFADNLNAQVDVSFMHSPYNTLGKNMQNSFNGVFISRAAVNYEPWKDVHVSLLYHNMPNSYYDPYYSYGRYGFGSSLFGREDFFGR